MKKTAYLYVILFVIACIGLLLRIYKVEQIPPSLSWDEVSIGYNAYSILKTGKDEHGISFPLATFTAYGDYKPPVAIYLTVPFVALFGLNELSVRLPSVLVGTLTICVIYFLANELFYGHSKRHYIALLSSAVLTFSPWHIQLSRAGFEANVGTFFIVLGIWLFLASRRRVYLLPLSIIPFVASVYTFNSTRYVAPLILIGLSMYFREVLKRNIRFVAYSCILCVILLIPIMPHLLSSQSRLRFSEVNIFTDPTIVETANRRQQEDQNSINSKIFDNRRIGYARSYLKHFFDNISPRFLFINGDGNPKFSIQDVGQLYMIDSIFIALGIYYFYSFYPSIALLLAYWLIISIVPAAAARETPHALRIENGLPVYVLFITLGIFQIFRIVKSKYFNMGVCILIVGMYLFSIVSYLHTYYIHYAKEYSGEWQYGYKQALEYIAQMSNEYEHIYISDSIGRPYMYVLFYNKIDPTFFRSHVRESFDAAGFYHVNEIGKYTFVRGRISSYNTNSLYILDPSAVPIQARVLHTVKLLNNDPILVVFTI